MNAAGTDSRSGAWATFHLSAGAGMALQDSAVAGAGIWLDSASSRDSGFAWAGYKSTMPTGGLDLLL